MRRTKIITREISEQLAKSVKAVDQRKKEDVSVLIVGLETRQ